MRIPETLSSCQTTRMVTGLTQRRSQDSRPPTRWARVPRRDASLVRGGVRTSGLIRVAVIAETSSEAKLGQGRGAPVRPWRSRRRGRSAAIRRARRGPGDPGEDQHVVAGRDVSIDGAVEEGSAVLDDRLARRSGFHRTSAKRLMPLVAKVVASPSWSSARRCTPSRCFSRPWPGGCRAGDREGHHRRVDRNRGQRRRGEPGRTSATFGGDHDDARRMVAEDQAEEPVGHGCELGLVLVGADARSSGVHLLGA